MNKNILIGAALLAAFVGFVWWPRRNLSLRNWAKRPDNFNSLTAAQQRAYDAALTRAANSKSNGSEFE